MISQKIVTRYSYLYNFLGPLLHVCTMFTKLDQNQPTAAKSLCARSLGQDTDQAGIFWGLLNDFWCLMGGPK